MNTAIEDLKKLHLANLITINELKIRVGQLESEKEEQFRETMLGIIEVIDEYRKAGKILSKKERMKSGKRKKAKKHYQTALKTLKEILKRNNVLKIEISQLIFSDQLCEVAGIISIPDMADNTVYKIVKNGYMCGTVLLRKAGVILVKNPSENSSAEFNEAELR